MNAKYGQVPLVPENAPFSTEQRAWLNGFLAGLFGDSSGTSAGLAVKPKISLPILYGSQTGTAEQLAKRMATEAGRRASVRGHLPCWDGSHRPQDLIPGRPVSCYVPAGGVPLSP